MDRKMLSDAQWDRIKDLVPGKESDRGMTGRDNPTQSVKKAIPKDAQF